MLETLRNFSENRRNKIKKANSINSRNYKFETQDIVGIKFKIFFALKNLKINSWFFHGFLALKRFI